MFQWRILVCYIVATMLLAASCLDVRPHYTFDIALAKVWRCNLQVSGWNISNVDRVVTQGNGAALLLKRGRTWVEIATSMTWYQMRDSLGLLDCLWLANISSLVQHEAQGISLPLQSRDLGPSPRRRARVMRGVEPAPEDGEAWFTQYHNLSQTYLWFHKLAESYPDVVVLNSSIGKTHHSYSIMAVHITSKGAGQATKPTIYLQCLLHAREWITGPVCMFLSHFLASSDDPQVLGLLEKFEFIIVPVANPDGYLLTWSDYPKYRLWRKNVAPVEGAACVGVDLNRNFDSHWNVSDGSGDPCSEQYSGPHTASELETKAITSYLLGHAPVVGAIDFHSYYQEVLYPPAWTTASNMHTSRMKYIAQWVASASSQLGTSYTAGSMGNVYIAGGTFPDWLYDQSVKRGGGTSLCFAVPLTMELRPKSSSQGNFLTGFMVPTSEILPTCKEMVTPLVKFGQLLLSNGCTL